MERFKGLAILATNRRKDLDEAFLRRLRFVVEFPLPGAPERRRIWRSVIPEGVDASALDFDFLAQRFPLAGGHIRAIVFHACLQSAADGRRRAQLDDADAVISSPCKREYDKLERASSLDQFGPYAPLVAAGRWHERRLPIDRLDLRPARRRRRATAAAAGCSAARSASALARGMADRPRRARSTPAASRRRRRQSRPARHAGGGVAARPRAADASRRAPAGEG